MNSDKFRIQIDNILNASNTDEANKLIKTASEVYNISIEDFYKFFYERIEEVCRSKLDELNKCKNSIQQALLRRDLERWLNRFIDDKQKTSLLITKLESTIIKPPEIYTLYDLKRLKESIKVDYLVSEFLPRDCYVLFASKPKIGKTNFVSNLIISLITGRDWLNRKVVRSRVLFIQNEEPVETITLDRLESGLSDIQLNDPDLYDELIRSKQLVVARQLDLVADLEAILQLVKDFEIDLVVVDSLSKSIALKSGLTEYSQELFPKLNQWQQACHRMHFTSIIIHHTTKVESTKDGKVNSDAIAGSNHLLRNNDGFWILDTTKNKDELICYMVPRFSTEKAVTCRRVEGEACYWNYEVVKESHLSPEELHLQNTIIRVLHSRWEEWMSSKQETEVYGLTLQEIIKATSSSRSPVITCLNRMLRTQGIDKYISNKTFIYHYPKEGTSWMEVYLSKEDDMGLNPDLNTTNKIKLLGCTTTEDTNNLIDSWSDPQKMAIWKLLTEEEKNKVLLLRYPPTYSVGGFYEGKEVKAVYYDHINHYHVYTFDNGDQMTL